MRATQNTVSGMHPVAIVSPACTAPQTSLGMKEYKLLAWPDLPVEFRRTGIRRLLSDLSQRHLAEATLLRREGVKPAEVRALLQFLSQANALDVRQAQPAASRWRPLLAGWWRRLAT